METQRQHRSFSGKARRACIITLLLLMSALLLFMPALVTGAITPQSIVDAILGRSTATSDMDVNQDGKVDVADVVRLQKKDTGHSVSFQEPDSSLREDAQAHHVIPVRFSKPFTGDLHFSILYDDYDPLGGSGGKRSCTATYDVDYTMPGAAISPPPSTETNQMAAFKGVISGLVNVQETSIRVAPINNQDYAFQRRIVLALDSRSGSPIPGPIATHTVTLIEDDLPYAGIWYATVSLSRVEHESDPMPISVNYDFIFKLDRVSTTALTGEVLSISTHQPDKPILQQIESQDSQTFSPASNIQVGTPVTAEIKSNGALVVSLLNISVEFNNTLNPFPVGLRRDLIITGPPDRGMTPFVIECQAREVTHNLGDIPHPLILTGISFLSYIGPVESETVVAPTSAQRERATRTITPHSDFRLTQTSYRSYYTETVNDWHGYWDYTESYTVPSTPNDIMSIMNSIRDEKAPSTDMLFARSEYLNKFSETGSTEIDLPGGGKITVPNPAGAIQKSCKK